MSHISINNISFHYASPFREIFKDFSIDIDQSWRTGLIGSNGSGKTTLLKLISGILKPDRGDIQISRPVHHCNLYVNTDSIVINVLKQAIAPFDQWEEAMKRHIDNGNMEAYGNIEEQYALHNGYTVESRIEQEISESGFDVSILNRSFSSLSGGEQTMLLIAAMFVNSKYAVIDEPTNHVDIYGRKSIAEYLSHKDGYILVSHDRTLLNRCTDHTIALTPTGVEIIKGNYNAWKEQFDMRMEFEKHRNDHLKREIFQMKQSFRQRKSWSLNKEKEKIGAADKGAVGAQAKRLMKRAKNIERRMTRAIDEKEALLHDSQKERRLHIGPKNGRKSIISCDDLSLSIGGRTLFKHISFNVQRGDVLAISGRNGAGKTMLLDIICQEREPDEGYISMKGDIELYRVFQQCPYMDMPIAGLADEHDIDIRMLSYFMNYLGVQGNIINKRTDELSEGERKKLTISLSLCADADLLVWDEPLNYLDVSAREMIEAMIIESKPTIIAVEHDKTFINNVADKIIEI